MSAQFHALALLLSITLAYLWLQVPTLRMYSFQVFALMIVTFLVLKRLRRAKLWHILPEWASHEITVLTFAFLLLIGATGNTKSLFYPLGYVHLFFLVMASHTPTAIVTTIAIMFFHYALDPQLDTSTIQSIITLPIMLAIFLFARKQYDEAHLAKLSAAHKEQQKDATAQSTQEQPTPDPLTHSTIASEETEATSSNA